MVPSQIATPVRENEKREGNHDDLSQEVASCAAGDKVYLQGTWPTAPSPHLLGPTSVVVGLPRNGREVEASTEPCVGFLRCSDKLKADHADVAGHASRNATGASLRKEAGTRGRGIEEAEHQTVTNTERQNTALRVLWVGLERCGP